MIVSVIHLDLLYSTIILCRFHSLNEFKLFSGKCLLGNNGLIAVKGMQVHLKG